MNVNLVNRVSDNYYVTTISFFYLFLVFSNLHCENTFINVIFFCKCVVFQIRLGPMCMNCTCIQVPIIKTVNIYLFKVRASPKGSSFHCEKVEQFMHANKKRKASCQKLWNIKLILWKFIINLKYMTNQKSIYISYKMEDLPLWKKCRAVYIAFGSSCARKKKFSRMLSRVVSLPTPLFSLSLRRSLIFSVITRGERNAIQRLRTWRRADESISLLSSFSVS